MKDQNLEIKAAIQILKPIHEVFEAIADPEKMSQYFIEKGSGRMEEGKILNWKFPEFDMNVPIRVVKIVPDKHISYYWDNEEKQLLVEMNLSQGNNNSTIVRITEKAMQNDEKGLAWFGGNTEGWANFLACLKAYLEYGINLRKGAFDFMK